MHKIVRLIVASGEQCADLRYAAGFSTPDEFIYFDDGTRRGVVMSALEYGRAIHSGSAGRRGARRDRVRPEPA